MTPPPQILLVDDLDNNRVALRALLGGLDAELREARSGKEALELLLVHDFALAIVDVQMPEMDGFELAELMRGAERTRDVPIVFVTAGIHDQARVFRGYESGAVDFLHKPLDPHVLRSKVEVFLQLHRQKQLLAEQLREMRRAEQGLREADRRKDEFLGLLSHELRNPLTPIANSVYILQRAEAGSEQARRAQAIIARQVQHLSRLVNDLLDVTRITRGKVQLQKERMDLAETLVKTAEDHRHSFVENGLELRVTTPEEPVWTRADPTRIAQVIGNLLVNALKVTPAGGRVAVSLERAGGTAVLSVSDDGVGISPEMADRIFQPFTQADRTLARSRGGVGLGLTLVKGMVELHGGSVSVASDGPGKGATFTVRLPAEAEAGQRGAASARPGGAGRTRRILLVEDNHDTRDTLREALQIMGHDVEVARDGPEGIALAERIRPEVVVCDIGLPGMSGYEVATRLRVIVPGAALIALSGYALPEDRRRAEEAGFSRYLAKPARLEDLEELLREL